jgi:hypothetical protein
MTDHDNPAEPNIDAIEPPNASNTGQLNTNNGTSPEILATERDCYIFLPGMGSNASVDQSVLGVAAQMARVMNLNAKDDAVEFFAKVEAAKEAGDTSGERGTIYRRDPSGIRPILDLFTYDYRGQLVERFENRNLFVRTFLLLWALPPSMVRVVRAFFTRGTAKTRAEMIQLFYALIILSVLVMYVGILFVALWATLVQLHVIPPGAGTGLQIWLVSSLKSVAAAVLPDGWLPYLQSVWHRVPPAFTFAQATVVISAVAAFFLPAGTTLKNLIGKAAVNYLCLMYYLDIGDGRGPVQGQLEVMIDNILQKSATARRQGKEGSYRTINIIAYSFGSIVALDSLFPIDREPTRPLQRISTLITIGCPFDFVRSLWRDYFDLRRRYLTGSPSRWLNVYSLEDVLGSNFRNDPTAGDANINIQGETNDGVAGIPIPGENVHYTHGLNYSNLSWTSSLTLLGLRSHSMYWGAGAGPEMNCFNMLVPRIFEGDPVLD